MSKKVSEDSTFQGKFYEFPNNPRRITEEGLLKLRESLVELGSLDGFVVNFSQGKYFRCVISGNQKNKHVNLDLAEIQIVKRFEKPTNAGTIAYGFALFEGEQFPYREVIWSEKKCEVANLRANNLGGQNDAELLAMFDTAVLLDGGIDLEFEKAFEEFQKQFEAQGEGEVIPPEPEDLTGDLKNKAATMKITFASPEDLQAAEPEISEILARFDGSFFSVNAGQA